MGGVKELRDDLQLKVSKIPKQEQVRYRQSTRLDAPLQVRHVPRQGQAGSGATFKKVLTTGASKGALTSGGAPSAAIDHAFPIKILDNLEDRNCACSRTCYIHYF